MTTTFLHFLNFFPHAATDHLQQIRMSCNVLSSDIQKARKFAKRRRASIACKSCKGLKSKCSDYRPCARCKKSNTVCIETQENQEEWLVYNSRLADSPQISVNFEAGPTASISEVEMISKHNVLDMAYCHLCNGQRSPLLKIPSMQTTLPSIYAPSMDGFEITQHTNSLPEFDVGSPTPAESCRKEYIAAKL